MGRPNQLPVRIKFHNEQHSKIGSDSLVLNDLQHRQVVFGAGLWGEGRMRMPLAKVVESRVVMPGPIKE